MIDLLFNEIAVVVITAGVLSLLLHYLKQPLVIAYIATGLIVGPTVLGLTSSPEVFDAMSEVGIAFLLFLVGINLNWRNIQDVGKIALLAGLGQMAFTTGFGMLVALWLGFNGVTSFLIALAFAFSSTIIIVKMLTDKEDLDRFYGRISVGMLIVQDLVAMIVLLIIGALAGGGSIGSILVVASLKGVLVIGALWLLAKFVLPHVFTYAAQSQELLFLTALSWCFAVASGLQLIGFGIEIGALLAGLSLAGTQFHREIELRIRPLRDFFLIIFFIVLGTHMSLDAFETMLMPAVWLSLFVLIGNPLIILLILRAFGYHPRSGFLVGLSMAQVSEFSFIMIASAIGTGLIDSSVLGLTTMVGITTIAISTYFLKYNEEIYTKLEWAFRFLEHGQDKEKLKKVSAPQVLLFGYEHLGKKILPAVKSLKEDYLVVDFDPSAILNLEEKRIPSIYGDVGNEEFLKDILAHKAKLIISTIPDISISVDLITYLKTKRSRASVVVTAKNPTQAEVLYEKGATFVILPSILGGELFASILKKKKFRKDYWKDEAKKQKIQLSK
ncbi:sodium:proton exchanger [Candidatus Uhrbacteria bacterium CG_4_10_14_0_2_um_filter_41_7]|uniref:Sodium:proton exchanger n=1 Tax=Candidatus Uhrbacteria bacterium CG_4_9_14_3_um_filter_41_35 TaxID=1975034 RepID=A0A2M7XE38_9BACT|nr:MAG: sodium:proton exchanger [Candidatus Uhrbacteria bacterium CG11_big_fil_rev_8_21_14_0_20_41_9]PIZ54155.1 MAG: sodium:proton exchanger [Candidatus Uhrbacteria bacterium CG_4_10_14_0_2_um_filter_41_7]PJA46115.1 MAG: sodium:proton exchanger [Candidatus Uhrbacteria bacterium CG_4_9_14_3_um_filter_41_35]